MRKVGEALKKAKRDKTPVLEVVQPLRMSYETYAYLKSLVQDQRKKLERDFQTACGFIPTGIVVKGLSGIDRAHEIFRKHQGELNKVEEELHAAAQASYADHPNPEMRKFWGIAS